MHQRISKTIAWGQSTLHDNKHKRLKSEKNENFFENLQLYYFLGGGGGEGIEGIFKEICQKFLGYPGWLYNWSLPYKSPNLSGKIDSGRVHLQAILKSHKMVVHINLSQELPQKIQINLL